eukprot:c12184_g1_i1.p1 GENE.c12184_g1_i1~~c12184_g1_i1.p1  ORF type:complete len:199 (+),score=69.25 c12184_g1_i1:103-699(+)
MKENDKSSHNQVKVQIPKKLSLKKGNSFRGPIIFLDIDGVLNTIYSYHPRNLDYELVQNLSTLIKVSRANIVLSSTWRLYTTLNRQILDLLSEHGCKPQTESDLLPSTPSIPLPKDSSMIDPTNKVLLQKMYAKQRCEEIFLWISKNKYRGKWIAIDDLPLSSVDPKMTDHFVQTNPACGFTTSRLVLGLCSLCAPAQ